MNAFRTASAALKADLLRQRRHGLSHHGPDEPQQGSSSNGKR
jgi:hypothetical protein